jgi:hypothetical protein
MLARAAKADVTPSYAPTFRRDAVVDFHKRYADTRRISRRQPGRRRAASVLP